MSRFNSQSVGTTTTNYAGGNAYKEDVKLEIASILLTSFVQDQSYRSADDTIARLKELVAQLPDKRYAAQAALYARTHYGLRSISHVVAGEIAKQVKGETWTRGFFAAVVQRPDDATEILSYYTAHYGKPIPNSLKDGLAEALAKFDAYQLGKYQAKDKDVSLVDVVNLTHPVPALRNATALKQLVEGTLKNTDTWESKLTAAGQAAESDEDKAELKSAAWTELIAERKLGYFALLRNLRNIIEQAPDALDDALAVLTNEQQVRKSKVLPFRFFTAYQQLRNVRGSSKALKAVSDALDLSLANLPDFSGKTLVVVDHSGSMQSQMSDKSEATCFQAGALLGVALAKVQDADFLYFGDTAKYYTINPADSTLSILERVQQLNNGGGWGDSRSGTQVGHGTNFHSIFETADNAYDRIVIFSDMQGWVGYNTPVATFNAYKKRTGASPTVFSVDLAGYGSLQFPQDKVFCLAGFSDKMLEVMPKLEQDRHALVREIEGVDWVQVSA